LDRSYRYERNRFFTAALALFNNAVNYTQRNKKSEMDYCLCNCANNAWNNSLLCHFNYLQYFFLNYIDKMHSLCYNKLADT